MNILYMEQYAFHTFCFIADNASWIFIYMVETIAVTIILRMVLMSEVFILQWSEEMKSTDVVVVVVVCLLILVYLFLLVWCGCCYPPG